MSTDRLLRLPEVERRVGLKKACIYLRIKGRKDDFLRAAVEDYVTNHRYADSVADIVRKDSQEPEESPR